TTFNNKIGFAGSMFSGYGLSYEYDLSRAFTLEFTGSIYGTGGTNNNTNNYVTSYLVSTIGTELQRNFYVGHDSRFYSYVGLGFWIDNTNYNNDYDNNSSNDTYSHETDYSAGIGLGWEYALSRRFIFNVEGGYLYRDMYVKGTNYIYDNIFGRRIEAYADHTYYIGFGVGVGIYYAF
ncbi:MAG: hypothetical protein HYZ54_02060, partial [Ignavibacteriae bacterium]|nr:hypothetical protein [Ignavibacteriota bacterium]